MEQIRRQALSCFEQNSHFSGTSQTSYILSHEPTPLWEPFPETELYAQAESRLAAGASVLVSLPLVSADIRFDFERELFIAMVDLFQLDHAIFRPLSSIESTFCWYPGKNNYTFYARVSVNAGLWTFDRRSGTTRGLVIPCGTKKYDLYELE